MSTFNINNSKVEQLNDTGNNYKFAGKSENNTVAEKGNVVQTTGSENKVVVDKPKAEEPKEGFWAQAGKKLLGLWKWIRGGV
ncbi:hypothetical protein VT84_20000 [Gemmata sp. SH-PL17]|uniref:hypothetical protein n=1 Tax=Gemmata sp. SH-PL17 TaxID=1630693 RepID=UPI00078D2EC4|nr:hypothetical protein [Gemmata sp. SH-PL17]AMV26693.1 hypothetical protein VT84_20000 [Gemmata sp. SH-PL17]